MRITRCVLLVQADQPTKPMLESLLNAIERIDSDYERGVIMNELAIHIVADVELMERFQVIANRLSSHERDQILKRLKSLRK